MRPCRSGLLRNLRTGESDGLPRDGLASFSLAGREHHVIGGSIALGAGSAGITSDRITAVGSTSTGTASVVGSAAVASWRSAVNGKHLLDRCYGFPIQQSCELGSSCVLPAATEYVLSTGSRGCLCTECGRCDVRHKIYVGVKDFLPVHRVALVSPAGFIGVAKFAENALSGPAVLFAAGPTATSKVAHGPLVHEVGSPHAARPWFTQLDGLDGRIGGATWVHHHHRRERRRSG